MELKDAGSKSQLLQKEDYRKKAIFSEYFKYILFLVCFVLVLIELIGWYALCFHELSCPGEL